VTADAVVARRQELAALLAAGGLGDGVRLGPASFAQRRQWIIDRLVPGSAEYNVAIAVRITEPLDPDILRIALERTVARQESLRTVFVARDDALLQKVLPSGPVELPLVDLSTRPDPVAAARAWAARIAAEPFDLAGPPLVRPTLLRIGRDDHLFVAITHHIVCDGWSAGIFCREIDEQYVAERAGRAARLPALPLQYLDHAKLERRTLDADGLAEQVGYWRDRLRGVPGVLRLPIDRPRAAVRRVRADLCPMSLPGDQVRRLQELATQEGCTLFVVLLAGFHALLARYSGQPTVVTGVPVAGRTRSDVENLIGFFVNTLVLRGDFADNPSLRVAVRRTRDAVLGALGHQDVPFERVVELLHPERDPAVSPFFQALFNYQAAFGERITLPGIGGTVEPLDNGTVRFDLEVNLIGLPGSIEGAWNYNSELFDRATIERMAADFRSLLDNAVRTPDRGMLDVPLLAPSERDRIVALGTGEPAPEPSGTGVHDLIADTAGRTPDAVAIRAGTENVTYRALLARSAQLVEAIRSSAAPAGPVALVMARSPEFVAAVLACRATGVLCVPLDPDAAPGHLRDVLRDCGVRLVLTQRRLADRLRTIDATVLVTDRLPVAHRVVAPTTRWADAAFARYLAGARPPVGALVADAALVAQCDWLAGRLPLGPDGRVLWSAPPDEDLVVELLWPLSRGATVVLAPPVGGGAAPDPARLVELVRAEGVQVVHWTPRLLDAVLATPGVVRCHSLRTVVCSGGPLWPWTVRTAEELLPGTEIYSCYATAATGIALFGEPPHGDRPGAVPTGRPVPGRHVVVLTPSGEPAPLGVVGELAVGGIDPVAGMPGSAALTAARYVPDPFGPPGSRRYLTGDLARLRATGTVEVLGPAAAMTTVRGVMLEPGEVESALAEHPDVVAAVTVFGADKPMSYVHARGQDDGARLLAALGARARRLLPKDLVPGTFVLLDRMPLLPNGKLDAAALPAMSRRARWSEQDRPRTPAEARIAQIWSEVLGPRYIGVHDDFFQIGGHSLLALRLADRLRTLGVDIPVSMLFRYRTVAALADWFGELGLRDAPATTRPTGPVHRLQVGAVAPPLVLLHGAGGTALSYSGLISALPDRTVYAIESGDVVEDLPTMASRYLAAVTEVVGVPAVLAGWSMGGVVALEMACQLGDDVAEPPTVVMIDSYLADDTAHADPDAWLVDSFLAGLCREIGQDGPEPFVGTPEERLRAGAVRSGLDETALRRRYAIYRKDMLALRDYRPGHYRGPVHLVHALASPAARARLRLAQAVEHEIPGDHWSLLDRDHVPHLARILEEVLCARASTRSVLS
jgi:non-ribosomal peptide synthetase component F/thioesterase domain-containing protein